MEILPSNELVLSDLSLSVLMASWRSFSSIKVGEIDYLGCYSFSDISSSALRSEFLPGDFLTS